MKLIFFYGLFMDEMLLKEKDFNPSYPAQAYVNNFGLRIGERATLVKSKGERAYGLVMRLDEKELNKQYANSLAVIAKKNSLPADYINEIKGWEV